MKYDANNRDPEYVKGCWTFLRKEVSGAMAKIEARRIVARYIFLPDEWCLLAFDELNGVAMNPTIMFGCKVYSLTGNDPEGLGSRVESHKAYGPHIEPMPKVQDIDNPDDYVPGQMRKYEGEITRTRKCTKTIEFEARSRDEALRMLYGMARKPDDSGEYTETDSNVDDVRRVDEGE